MSKLDRFTSAYLECAVWASLQEDGSPLDALDADLAPETIAQAVAECKAFQEANKDALESIDDAQAGHDFWLTRNNHGAGFWDRGHAKDVSDALCTASKAAGERDLYVGDDGQLYFH